MKSGTDCTLMHHTEMQVNINACRPAKDFAKRQMQGASTDESTMHEAEKKTDNIKLLLIIY
jgi:hypothetical protein